jgi:hypothetical protein
MRLLRQVTFVVLASYIASWTGFVSAAVHNAEHQVFHQQHPGQSHSHDHQPAAPHSHDATDPDRVSLPFDSFVAHFTASTAPTVSHQHPKPIAGILLNDMAHDAPAFAGYRVFANGPPTQSIVIAASLPNRAPPAQA